MALLGCLSKEIEKCGYSGNLLEKSYTYEDGEGSHTVELAGFSSEVRDLRTSCISALCCEESQEVSNDFVYGYRGIGTPVVFVCEPNAIQWWTISSTGAEHKETITKTRVEGFFEKHKSEFAPDRVSRAKNLARVDRGQQLAFVDCGLTPLLEHETGERLGELMNRVLRLLGEGFTEKQLEKALTQRWLFRAGLWLLCGKILKDKGVRSFKGLNLEDADAVIKAVSGHYGAREGLEIGTGRRRIAIEKGLKEIAQFSSLNLLTTEAFGYVYENVLVDKNLRAALGIHATPPYLVSYIMWKLWPWIQGMPEEERVVLEPACGHAPFLTGALRLLREFFEGGTGGFHKYAQKNLIGMEVDSFASEIARLSLTLADVPNANGWNILEEDIYRGNNLRQQAAKSMILLGNPPFEDFTPDERKEYDSAGQLRSSNKAAELLWNTLPFLPLGSVFGVVLPRGFLNRAALSDLREMILKDFELQEVCCLPKTGVFLESRHESVVLLGQKGKTRRHAELSSHRIFYRHVPQKELDFFREKYEARDEHIPQCRFLDSDTFDLRLRELDEVWKYCEEHYQEFRSIADGGQGLSYKGRDLPKGARTFDKGRFTGAVRGYAVFDRSTVLHGLPKEHWMSLNPEVIQRPRSGLETGTAQIIMNYAPVGAGPWRLKALVDRSGRPVSSRFLVFRGRNQCWSLNALWGILNSPLANAYVYVHTTDRAIPAEVIRSMPIPASSKESLRTVEQRVEEYFEVAGKCDLEAGIDVQQRARGLLLSIDAEVMRLYDLPPKFERQVLELFAGHQRKGVDFKFERYYPEGFDSWIPLHEYLSEEYQRSTPSFVNKWVEKNRSPEVIKALKSAMEAFEG
jgi:hypothetical protein